MGRYNSYKFNSIYMGYDSFLPGTILYIFLGATAGSLTDSGSSGDNSTVKIITIVVGVVFGVLGVGAVSYYAKKELNNVIQKAEEENNEDAVTSSAHHVDIEAGNAKESSTKDNVNNSILNDNEGKLSTLAAES